MLPKAKQQVRRSYQLKAVEGKKPKTPLVSQKNLLIIPIFNCGVLNHCLSTEL